MIVFVISIPAIRGSSVLIIFVCMFDMYNTALVDDVTLLAVLACELDFLYSFLELYKVSVDRSYLLQHGL